MNAKTPRPPRMGGERESFLFRLSWRFGVLAFIACLWTLPAAAEVVLTGPHWRIAIDAEWLAVSARADGNEYQISAPREKPARVAELKSDASQASWTLPDD